MWFPNYYRSGRGLRSMPLMTMDFFRVHYSRLHIFPSLLVCIKSTRQSIEIDIIHWTSWDIIITVATMKLSSALISLIAATGAVEGFKIQTAEDKLRVKQDFMAAMHQKTAIKKAGKLGKAQKLKKLNEDLMTASRKLASNGGNSYYNGSQQQQQQADNYDQQQQQASSQGYSSFLADQEGNLYFQGDDGLYYDAYGAVVYPNDSGLYPWEYNAIPYDLSARALKYAGCAAIKTYDTEQAQYTGNPMVIDTMAVFRLCPASSCNQYSITGCGKNYGEYTVDVKTYLTYLLSYYDDEYNNYCEYCNACDYDVQATRKQSLSECHEQMNQDDWEYTQQLQQQAYQDFLNANGGEADNAGFHFYGQSPYNDGSGFDSYNGQYYNGANTQGGVNNPSSYYSQHDYSSNSSTNEYNQYYQEDNSTNRHLEDEDQDQNQNQNQNSGAYQNQYYRGLYGNGNGQQAYKQCQQFVSSMQAMYSTADRSDYYNSNQNYNNANAQSYYDENGNYNANGYQNNNGNANSINDASMADYWDTQDCCLDGSVCDACQIEAEQTYGDCDHYVCGDYYNYCESNYYQDDDDVDLLEFLECVAYTDENSGMEYYLGPHCGSDHYTISLGLFSDENCLDYVGDSVSLSSVLGFQYQDSDLFKFPEGCISCEGVVSLMWFNHSSLSSRVFITNYISLSVSICRKNTPSRKKAIMTAHTASTAKHLIRTWIPFWPCAHLSTKCLPNATRT
jgi:hypothetical protein